MQRNFNRTLGMLALAAASSCSKDLNQTPSYSANSEVVYSDPAQIEQVLSRLYATFAISGQNGPASPISRVLMKASQTTCASTGRFRK